MQKNKIRSLLSLAVLAIFGVLAAGSVNEEEIKQEMEKRQAEIEEQAKQEMENQIDKAEEEMKQKIEETENDVKDYVKNQGQWKPYNSTIGKFKILFPGDPMHTEEKEPSSATQVGYTTNSYFYETDEIAYYVDVVEYNNDIDASNPKINLENSLNGMVNSSAGNKLVSSEFSTYKNQYTQLEYKIVNPNQKIVFQGRNIWVGKTMYMIMVTYIDDQNFQTEYNKFVNSFELTS
jgi:hypothetical protein